MVDMVDNMELAFIAWSAYPGSAIAEQGPDQPGQFGLPAGDTDFAEGVGCQLCPECVHQSVGCVLTVC